MKSNSVTLRIKAYEAEAKAIIMHVKALKVLRDRMDIKKLAQKEAKNWIKTDKYIYTWDATDGIKEVKVKRAKK